MLSRISYSAAVLGSLSTVAERAQCFAELKKCSEQRKQEYRSIFSRHPKGCARSKKYKFYNVINKLQNINLTRTERLCHKKEQSFLNGQGWVFFLLCLLSAVTGAKAVFGNKEEITVGMKLATVWALASSG